MNKKDRRRLNLYKFQDARGRLLLVNHMPGTHFIGQEGFQLNGFVREFTRDEERVSKNKERGGYKVEIGRMPEGNVTDDLLVTYTTIVNHSLFTINIH